MLNKQTGILGGGSWATAIVKILCDSGTEKNINWFIRNPKNIEYIKSRKRNKFYLSSLELQTEKLSLCDDINQIIKKSDILIFAIPSAFIKNALANTDFDLSEKIIVSAVKGMIPDDNLIFAEYFNQKYNIPKEKICIIAGPSHSEEIAAERLSYLTIASENKSLAEFIGNKLKTKYSRINISDDIYGTEYSAVLKNIYALAAGICHGLGYGDNFQAVLVSNAVREMKRFVDKVHPISRDIKDSVYLGDLLVTAYSKFSRNHIFGTMIGKGYSVKAAQLEMNMIAEGYYAAKSIYEINKNHKIFIPITNAVYHILYENKNPAEEIKLLTDNLT